MKSAAATTTKTWGDEEEEEESPLPTPVNQNRSKAREFRIRVPLITKTRRNLPRFGEAKIGEENVTLRSNDFIAMEHPDDAMLEDAEDPVFGKTLLASINKNMALKDPDFNRDEEEPGFSKPSEGVGSNTPGAGESKAGVTKYVAPGARAGAASSSGGDRDGTENTLRVSNLSKATTEDDLHDLFGRFGRIHRVSLPKVEDRLGEKVPRGFAYIAFVRKDDAEAAMEALQGYGYDHLIIKIEWAKPNAGGGGGGFGGGGNVYRSGYGQKLAQETTEKAVFTSTKS